MPYPTVIKMASPTGLSVHPRPAFPGSPSLARRLFRRVTGAVVATLVLAGSAQAQTPSVVSRFDLDAEGWTVSDIASGTGSAAVNWFAPGYIQTADLFDWTVFSAPAHWLDQLDTFVGGSLSFDLQAVRQDPGAAIYFTAAMRSGTDLLVWFAGAPSNSEFTHFEVALDPAAGWRLNPTTLRSPGTGQVLDTAGFTAFIAGAEALYINADWRTGADDVRLDNVVLQAVPEPATWLLMLAGSGLMLAWRRRDGPEAACLAGCT